MNEIHFYDIKNMIQAVEALAKEKYNFKVETAPNGTWNITVDVNSINHANVI